jgi:hypothetical protein
LIKSKYSVALETAFQVKVGVIVVSVPEGEIRVVDSGGERIVKDWLAGVGSSFPTWSSALTWKT